MPGTDPRFPFSVELGKQHAELRAALHWIETAVERAGAGFRPSPGLVDALIELRDRMGRHFRFEELGGFEGGFRSRDPGIQLCASELVRQHRQLERALDSILAHALGPGGCESDTTRELCTFLCQLRQHDAREDALLRRIDAAGGAGSPSPSGREWPAGASGRS